MGLTKKEIYEKIARKELSPQEGMRLLKGIEKENVPASIILDQDQPDFYLNAVIKDIRQMLSEISQIPELKTETGFFEQGLESVHLMEIVRKIENKMKVDLYPTLLFEYTSIKDLAEYLVNEFGDKYPVSANVLQPVESSYQTAVENDIKKMLSELNGIALEKIESEKGFFEQGFESTHLMETVRKIEDKMGVDLYPTLLFEYTNIKDLAEYLINEFRDKYPADYKNSSPKAEKLQQAKIAPVPAPSSNQDIAVIGLAGKYPMSEDMDQLWENLKNGKDCVTEVPEERWNWKEYYDPDMEKAYDGKIYCKEGGFINDVDKFDPLFFGISPREAELIDPQERWFLQICWKTLEDAGYTPENIGKDVGVFAGVTTNTYSLLGTYEWLKGNPVIPRSYPWSVANKVSYCFNFTGPSLPIDTACSSSLVAIHYACQSIKNGECSAAIAGGVNFYLHYSKFLMLCQNQMLSPNGRCFTFGKDANGFGPGEGVGAILLKPLFQAEKDHDHIYGVIKSSFVNHGGKASGYYVPNPKEQGNVIKEALTRGNISPESISYIEAHGTGTNIGDPIEIRGLSRAFSEFTDKKQYCPIGSVKANIGHLEAAAGISGVTKILLQMKHQQLVPSIHTEKLNPNILFDHSPVYVQKKLEEWKKPLEYPRRAAISSFGAGGTNAHVIIEDYQETRPSVKTDAPQIIVLSARNKNRLQEYAKIMAEYFEKGSGANISLRDTAYTLQTGRIKLTERIAFVAEDFNQVIRKLKSFQNGNNSELYTGSISQKTEKKQSRLEIALIEQDLETIAELWVEGLEVNWKKLHNNQLEKKISLPTYPFEKKSFWLPEKEGKIVIEPSSKIITQALIFDEELESEIEIESRGELVRKEISSLLKIPVQEITADLNLDDLGIDSITTMQLIKNLNNKLSINLGLNDIWDSRIENIINMVDNILSKKTMAENNQLSLSENNLEIVLKWHISQLLKLPEEEIDMNQTLADFGIDSIAAMQLVKNLNNDLNIDLSLNDILQNNKVGAILSLLKTVSRV